MYKQPGKVTHTHFTTWIRGFRNATLRKIMKTYRSLKIKATKISADIEFMSKCQKANIIPNFIRHSLAKYKGNKFLKAQLMTTAMSWEINSKYAQRDEIYKKIMYLHIELAHLLHSIEFEIFTDRLQEHISKINYPPHFDGL